MALRKPFIVMDRYFRIEVCFFIGLFILMPMLTDVEYAFNLEPNQFSDNAYHVRVIRRLVWGVFQIIPYYLFYKLAIQGLLIKKRFGWFLLSFVGLIFFLEFYTVYITYGSITKMTFLPDALVREAGRWRKPTGRLHFTITYLIIQLLQLIALAYFIGYDREQKKVMALQQLQTESDLKALRAQLQPHFFFNTLNNIYSLALVQSADTAPLVARLSAMMRYVMERASLPALPLTEEVAFLQDYVAVQLVRFHDSSHIRFDTQGITPDVMIEPLLLLPFVENAFKHGAETVAGGGAINIVLVLTDKELTMVVQNTKGNLTEVVGMRIGISNTQQRLALLYPGKHSLEIQDTADHFSVTLTLLLS